jgi:thiol-disulfide isomerase/thioredoxin
MKTNHRLALSGVVLATLAATVSLSPRSSAADPVAPAQPSIESVTADYRKQFSNLQEIIGDNSTVTDADNRAQSAASASKVLSKLVDDCNQLIDLDPEHADETRARRAEFLVHLSLFGDADATRTLQREANSTDADTALEGKRSQLMVAWIAAAFDEDAQGKIVDQIEALAKQNINSEPLTTQLNHMSSLACSSPELSKRLQSLVTDVMKNSVATSTKMQLEGSQKLAQLENHPLVIAGKTPEGKDFTTADWKGKVILVDFWATWCGPCKEELPRVKKMYEDYHAKGLEVLGVSNDQSADDLTGFIKDDGKMPWPQLFDAAAATGGQWNPITTGFGINGIPTMFLIDKKGVVRSVEARGNMETLIPQLLAEEAPAK